MKPNEIIQMVKNFQQEAGSWKKRDLILNKQVKYLLGWLRTIAQYDPVAQEALDKFESGGF